MEIESWKNSNKVGKMDKKENWKMGKRNILEKWNKCNIEKWGILEKLEKMKNGKMEKFGTVWYHVVP